MKYIGRCLGGTLIGLLFGHFLFTAISHSLGDLWTVEAGAPYHVIISPYIVPILTGAVASLVRGLPRGCLGAMLSCVAYVAAGIGMIVVGAIAHYGWAGVVLCVIALECLLPCYYVIVIIFET